jgi:O-antigen/teichoic acid export membrane protein
LNQRINIANILANGLARVSSVVLSFLLVPLFVKYLGYEAYGLIGFYTFVFGLVALLEMGFPLSLNRAIARFTGGEKSAREISSLIRAFEISFFIICLVVTVLGLVGGSFIAESWLNANSLDQDVLEKSVYLIFILIGIRFPVGLYLAVLAGLQKQVKMNLWIMIFTLLRLGSAALAIIFWRPDILLFFQVQIFVSIIEVTTIRYSAWASHIDFNPREKFKFSDVKEELMFGMRIGGLSLMAVLIGQADKALASGMFELHEFGLYSIAVLFGLGITTIGYPIASAAFPHFAKAGYETQKQSIDFTYVTYCLISITVISAVAIAAFVHAEGLLLFYLGVEELPSDLLVITKVILIGGLFGGLIPIPYSFLTASGSLGNLYKLYSILAMPYLAVLYFLASDHGLLGISIAFSVMQSVTFFCIFWLANNTWVYKKRLRLIFQIIIAPLTIASGLAYGIDFILLLSFTNLHVLFKFSSTFIFIAVMLATIYNLKKRVLSQKIAAT